MVTRRTFQTQPRPGAMQEYQRAGWFAALAIAREQQQTAHALLTTWQQLCWPWLLAASQTEHENPPHDLKAPDAD